jgi:hypothetical protein
MQPTLQDLIRQLDSDNSINALERVRLLAEVKRLTNQAPGWTPLGSLMYGAFGALFGGLISRYFGMGAVGRTISAVVGAGIGSSMYNRGREQDKGWRNI